MSDGRKIADIERLIEDFQQSGARELHVRADGFELYLSTDPAAPGIERAPSPATPAATPASALPAAPAAAPAGARSAGAAEPPQGDGAAATAAAVLTDDPAYPAGAVIVRAPYLGTFYRAPKPGAPVYVETGDQVTAESELCLVEVMKLFTAVRAGTAGRVHQILATDGQLVQADQPLFVLVAG